MDIKLNNTLTHKKEVFKPLNKGAVSMYHCGPTVYDDAHIGNLRSYVFADVLRRTFEYNDYEVKQVINITDVGHLVSDGDQGDDKMTKALKRLGKPFTLEAMYEVGTMYSDRFKSDLKALNILTPAEFPRASEYIRENLELIGELEKKGFAYKTSDGVYFDTGKFPSYFEFSGRKAPESSLEARIDTNKEKRSQADFALWKFDSKLGWESPWGKGFPGWHIECSAMSRKLLGQPFDIHTGGIDHIPTHHTNEIAQSEAAYGTPLARYWMHNAFITVNDSKMAKSAGGFLTLSGLLNDKISPLSYRYWLLTGHYSSPVNFSLEAVEAAQNALIKLMAIIGAYPDGGQVDGGYKERFNKLINNDLDTPQAVALVWEVTKDASLSAADKRATLVDFDQVLGLKLESAPRPKEEIIPEEIKALAEAREMARKAKDWTQADALRQEVEDRGFILEDSAQGVKITAK